MSPLGMISDYRARSKPELTQVYPEYIKVWPKSMRKERAREGGKESERYRNKEKELTYYL